MKFNIENNLEMIKLNEVDDLLRARLRNTTSCEGELVIGLIADLTLLRSKYRRFLTAYAIDHEKFEECIDVIRR